MKVTQKVHEDGISQLVERRKPRIKFEGNVGGDPNNPWPLKIKAKDTLPQVKPLEEMTLAELKEIKKVADQMRKNALNPGVYIGTSKKFPFLFFRRCYMIDGYSGEEIGKEVKKILKKGNPKKYASTTTPKKMLEEIEELEPQNIIDYIFRGSGLSRFLRKHKLIK